MAGWRQLGLTRGNVAHALEREHSCGFLAARVQEDGARAARAAVLSVSRTLRMHELSAIAPRQPSALLREKSLRKTILGGGSDSASSPTGK